MTNKRFHTVEQVQSHIDQIIKLSNIVENSPNGVAIHEETHINVDVILDEQISPIRKRKIERELREIRETVIRKEAEVLAMMTPEMPKREKLIVHEHIDEKKAFKKNLSSLFRSYSY